MSDTRFFGELEMDDARSASDPVCMLDLDGFSGPLDLLLELARRQKVDLAKISILTLVQQDLTFIEEARALRLELAADYLVMAAWLAFLKSRLLLPLVASPDEPNADDLAAALANRLRRLEAIRAVSRLFSVATSSALIAFWLASRQSGAACLLRTGSVVRLSPTGREASGTSSDWRRPSALGRNASALHKRPRR
jgi:hypothetical protein